MLMGMNCGDEKIVVISSTPTNNEWPQHYNDNNNNIIHMISSNEHQNQQSLITTTIMATSAAMDQTPSQDNLQALKCPRCESGNTKFCYYNNYSLSQPRHFCKACKRYWTRGGTLRNVPVGGGCRKNKRIRRLSSSSAGAATTTTTNSSNSASLNSSSSSSSLAMNNSHASTNSQPPRIDLLSAGHGSHHIASLFYNNELTLPTFSRYDHLVQQQPPPQLSGLGLGFSANGDSGLLSANSLLSSYTSIFGTPPAPSQLQPPLPPTTTITSLLASKFTNKDQVSGAFQALTPFEELGTAGFGDNKQVKLELEAQRRSPFGGWINSNGDHHHHHHHHQNQTDQVGLMSSSDLYWTNPTAVVGGSNWHDPTANIGSNSVPSLI